MKILYFVHGFPPSIGAGAINAYKIAKFLSEFGHSIFVLSPGIFSKKSTQNDLNSLSNLDISVKYSSKLMKIPLNLVVSHFENMLKYLIKLKSSFKPDVILSQYSAYHYASVIGGYLSKILNIPHIIRSHDIFFPTDTFSFPFKIFHSIIYTRIYSSISNCDIFYVTTTEMKRYYLKFDKLRNINFKIHHNGVDTDTFYPFNNQEELKDKYNCENIMLFIGQIGRDYDLQNTIKALPEILKSHKDTHFLIIGSGPQFAKENLLNFIKKNNLVKQVHFLGIKPHGDIPFYINNSDIGIGRISHEKIWRYMIPVKCLEYMGCGKPYITAPLSKDLIKDDDVGLLLKRNFTKEDLISKIISLIEDKSLRKKLGDSGLQKIRKSFKWVDLMSKFNDEILNST